MAVWVPVNAEMKGFVSHLIKEASGAGKQGAKKVADEFGKGGQEAGKKMADGLTSQAKLIDQATAKLSNARKVEAQAAARVTAAEKDLEILRESGEASASKLAAATQKLNTAKNKQRDASSTLARQESDLEAIQNGAEPTVAALARAEDTLAKARTDSQTAMDTVRTAEERLTEAKQLSEQRSEAVVAAEDKLARAREESGADSREATSAEKELEKAKKQSETAARGVAKEEGRLKIARAELESATDTVNAKSRTFEAVQKDVARAEREAADEAGKTGREVAKLGDEMADADGHGNTFANSLGSMAKKAALAGGALLGISGIGATLNAGFDKYTSLEDTTASLGIIMGNAEEATSVMDQLQESNQATPYSFDAWAGAGKNLIAFGVDADKTSRIVTALGEAAAASGKGETSLNSMADAFGKAAASGKISMDTINSLSEGGVQGLAILANEYGVTTEEMQKKISSGAISAVDGIDILTDGIIDGSDGIAGATASMTGVMDEMSGTTSGTITNMGSAFNNLGMEIMTMAAPYLQDFAEKTTEVVYNIRDFIREVTENEDLMNRLGIAFKVAGVMIGLFAAGMIAVKTVDFVNTLVGIHKTTGLVRGAFAKLNLTMLASPIFWIGVAIAAVAAGLIYFFTQTETGREIWDKAMAAMSLGWDLLRFALAKGWEFIREKVLAPLIGWILNTRDRFMNFVDRTKEGWQSFQDKAGDVVTNVKNFVGDMVTNISETPGKIKDVFTNAASWLVSAGRDIISGLWDGIRDMWDNVAGWFTDLPSRIRNSVGSLSFSFGGLFSGNADGSFAQYVSGGIDQLERYANGGGRENHVAQIARGKTPVRVWAEPETGGETYIPLAKSKRKRSMAILAKTAEIFGVGLFDPKTGLPPRIGYSGDLGPQDVHAFANGGITGEDLDAFARGQTAGGYRASRPLQGAPYIWGGSNWGDCSGTVSAFAALAKGLNPFPRKFYTGDMGAWLNRHGFIRGRGKKGDFRIGYKHGGPGGGHTAATLPNGVNVEMGGSPSEGHYNTGAGAWDKYFDTFFHLPMQIAEVFNDKVVGGLGDINTPMVTSGGTTSTATTAATVSAQDQVPTRPLTPQEVAAQTWSEEMGNRSMAQIASDAIFGYFGEDSSTFNKLAFTPMNELLGVPTGTDGASTSVAENNAIALNDAAVTSMTAEEMAKDPQLKSLKSPEVIEQPKVASWGPEFFAREIAKKAKSMGLDKVAAKIGIATALVESGDPMKMYANHAVPESLKFRHDAIGSDHDSIGLFQQRSSGWGNVRQRMTPSDSAGFFFNALRKFDYKNMDPGKAAQRVQVSAFPDRYGKKMSRADRLLADTDVFDRGGIARGIGFMPKATLRPEEVLSPDMTPLFRQFIGILPDVMDDYQGGALSAARLTGDMDALASSASRSGSSESAGTTVVINVDGQEVMRKRLDDAEDQIDINTDDIDTLKRKKKPRPSTTLRGGVQ